MLHSKPPSQITCFLNTVNQSEYKRLFFFLRTHGTAVSTYPPHLNSSVCSFEYSSDFELIRGTLVVEGFANLRRTKGHSGRDRCCSRCRCCCWCCLFCSQTLQLVRLLCQDYHSANTHSETHTHTVLLPAMLISCTVHCFQPVIDNLTLFMPLTPIDSPAPRCTSLNLQEAVGLNKG